MNNYKTQNNRRSDEIMLRLVQHGPLSSFVLNKMLKPKMKSQKLRQALQRLQDKNLIDTRTLGGSSHKAVYWQVSRDFLKKSASQSNTNYDPDYILNLRTSRRCLSSHEIRQLWVFMLSRLLPNAKLIRRDQIASHNDAKNIFNVQGQHEMQLPDYLIFFSDVNDERLCIALDIEEQRWSTEQIVKRLKNYARHTDLDGCIYVCSTGYLQETARVLTKSIQQDSRLRKLGYSNTYFTFSDAIDCNSLPLNQLLNSNCQAVTFEDWYVQISAYKQAQLNS